MTFTILASSFSIVIRNFLDYLKIGYFLIGFNIVYYIFIGIEPVFPETMDALDFLLLLLEILITTDFIIKIHKYTITGDDNYFKFDVSLIFKYILTFIIITILFFLLPLYVMYILIASTANSVLALTALIPVVYMIYYLPYIILLPITSIGKKVSIRNFSNYLSGFRLTLVLQTLFVILLAMILSIPHLFFITSLSLVVHYLFGGVMYFIVSIFSVVLLSETYKHWNNEYNVF